VPRKRAVAPEPTPPPAIRVQPRVIDPNAVFTRASFMAFFGISKNTLRNEIKEGRLRVSERGGKYLILAKWALQWIEAGELPPRNAEATKQQPAELNGHYQRNSGSH
jgi:hypothetical protein